MWGPFLKQIDFSALARAVLLAVVVSMITTTRSGAQARSPNDDSAAVAKVVNEFHRALSSGDSAAALALLSPDGVVLESGGIETMSEYRSHHLPSDIEFAQAVKSERSALNVSVLGQTAWTRASTVSQGTFRGRPVNSSGAESMVLIKNSRGWQIVSIHWSSRTRR